MSVNNTHLSLWERSVPTFEEFSLFSWEEKLETLAWLGHLAPSTHNTQPWRFFCKPETHSFIVALDRNFILPESDIVGRQTIVSIGCVMENIIVAAEALGLKPSIHYCDVTTEMVKPKKEKTIQPDIIAIASIEFTEGAVNTEMIPLAQAIRTRKTMRVEFDPTKLVDKKILDELTEKISVDSVDIHLVTDSLRRLSISEFQGQADGYVLNSPKFSRELGDWLLPNNTDASIGMPGDTFGFDDVQALRISRGLRGEGVLEPEDMLRFSLGGKVGFEKSPVIAFFTIEKDDVRGWLSAGRAMERAFLILEREQISFAIHAAIVEVRLINRIFAATLGTFKPLAAVFRLGYVKDEAMKLERPHSPRLSMSEILLTQEPANMN